MATLTIDDAILSNIADAIRGKNGTTDTYKPREMATAITDIPTSSGGGSVNELPIKNAYIGNLLDTYDTPASSGSTSRYYEKQRTYMMLEYDTSAYSGNSFKVFLDGFYYSRKWHSQITLDVYTNPEIKTYVEAWGKEDFATNSPGKQNGHKISSYGNKYNIYSIVSNNVYTDTEYTGDKTITIPKGTNSIVVVVESILGSVDDSNTIMAVALKGLKVMK